MWCRSFMKKCQFVTFSVEIADGVGSQKRLLYLLPLLKESQPGTPQRELGLGLVQLHVLAKSLLWDLIMGSPGESQFWHFFNIFFRYNSFWIYGVGKCLLHFAIPKRDCDQFLFMTCPCKHGIRVIWSFVRVKTLRSKGIDPKGTKMMRRLTVGRAQGGDLMRVPFLKVLFFGGLLWEDILRAFTGHIWYMHFLETMFFFQLFDMVFWNMCCNCCYVVSFNTGGGGNGVDQGS